MESKQYTVDFRRERGAKDFFVAFTLDLSLFLIEF
jgi:hypothetical protein